MSYDLSNLITQGFQNSSAARDNAFRNFAQGAQSVGEGVHALRQRGWNSENDRLMQEWYNMQAPQEDSETGEKLDPAAMLDPELLRLNEMQRRLHNLKGHAKGLRTNYTPQDYLKLDAEAQAMEAARQKAEADAKKDEEERERKILDGFSYDDNEFFGADEIFRKRGSLDPSSQASMVNLLISGQGENKLESKLNLLGELDPEGQKKFRNTLLQAAKTAPEKLKNEILKALNTSNWTGALSALPAAMLSQHLGNDTQTNLTLQNLVDARLRDAGLGEALMEKGRLRYTKEKLDTGRKHLGNRQIPEITEDITPETIEFNKLLRRLSKSPSEEKRSESPKPADRQKTKPVKQSSTEGF